MWKKLVLSVIALLFVTAHAFAQVDVNKATQAQLDGLKGIGPVKSKAILDERKKGEFKDWADFQTRVNGIGDKTAHDLSQDGMTINGKARPANMPKGGEDKPAAADKTSNKKEDKKADKKEDKKAVNKETKEAKETKEVKEEKAKDDKAVKADKKSAKDTEKMVKEADKAKKDSDKAAKEDKKEDKKNSKEAKKEEKK